MKAFFPMDPMTQSPCRAGSAIPPHIWLLAILLATARAEPPAGVMAEAPTITVDGQSAYALGFDRLAAFEYTIVDSATGATPEEVEQAKKRDQVPAWIRRYEGKRIALTGYMMPLKVENGLAKKLIMMRDITTCCYGNVPNMNEYVVVAMSGEGVKAIQDVPVVLVGVFRIAEKYENGYIVSLFQLEGEKFLGPRK